MKVRRIAIAVYNGVTGLDVAGPAEVFSTANELVSREPAPYHVVAAGSRRGRVAAESGVSLHADIAFKDNVSFDTIIVPGGRGVRLHAKTRAPVVQFLLAHSKRTRRIASVCTGIYALADTGLLDGRNVTTHWRYADDVGRLWPKLRVNADAIFISDGKFYTSAGVTAGIDLSLSFVEEDFGSELALAVAREIVVYLKRSGGQLQYSQPLLAQTKARTHFGNLTEWIRGNLQSDLTLETLAERMHLSTRHFVRKFKAVLGVTPSDFVEQLRLDEARWLLVNGDDPVNDLAQTVGYKGDDTFRRAFERRNGIAPAEYRRRFRLVDPFR
jgi:transcriptional regulator GlxA family with amidase domain